MSETICCPICAREIKATNVEEVDRGEHSSYIFVHDDIEHFDSDIDALEHGIN